MVQSKMCSPRKQQGMVIVLALFIVALVAAMAYTMMARLARDTERTTLVLQYNEALNLAAGSIAWARDQLRNNILLHKPTQLIDQLPLTSPVIEIDGYHIQSTIYDLQAFVNINNVQTKNGIEIFKQLLHHILPKQDMRQNENLIQALNEWLNTDVSKNKINEYYLHLHPAYRSAHRLMQSASELRLIKGFNASVFSALKSYIVALPSNAVINVQTAPAVVLASLSPTMTLDSANEIIAIRSRHPFTSKDVFLNTDIAKNHHVNRENIIVKSNYFLVKTVIKIDLHDILLCTYLKRTADQDHPSVNIIAQNIGLC